jgi:hypothetical protein
MDPTSGFYRQVKYGLPIGKLDLNFETQSKALRPLVKVFADPQTALLAEKSRDRQFAALALVARYRASRPHLDLKANAGEPIPADQNKLILETLAELRWDNEPFDPEGTMSLRNVFWQLQLTEKHGWQQPQAKADENADEVMGKAVAKWFNVHSANYRIQRLAVRPASVQ